MPALCDGRLDRSRYDLALDESFEGAELDGSRWLPWYLPHWSSRARTEARYALGGGMLRLPVGPYPREAFVHHVRGYRRRSAYDTDAGGPA